jgi:RNA polymerase sigma factor (sigma-70 family)
MALHASGTTTWQWGACVSFRTRCRRAFWKRLVSRDMPDEPGDDGSRWADQQASAKRAQAALATLSPPQREAIVLFELHGHTLEEIAEIQQTSLSSVKSRLVRGRDRLRAFYQPIHSLNEEVCRG